MMKQVWKYPVWSKVISVGILAVLSLIYAKTKSAIEDITFSQAFQSIFDTKIRIIYIIGGYFGVMVPRVSVKPCHFERYCNDIKN